MNYGCYRHSNLCACKFAVYLVCFMQLKADQKEAAPTVVMPPVVSPADSSAKATIAELRSQLLEEQRKHKQAKEAQLSEQQYFADAIANMEELTKSMDPACSDRMFACPVSEQAALLPVPCDDSTTCLQMSRATPPAARCTARSSE